jgi:hypothetical protein
VFQGLDALAFRQFTVQLSDADVLELELCVALVCEAQLKKKLGKKKWEEKILLTYFRLDLLFHFYPIPPL